MKTMSFIREGSQVDTSKRVHFLEMEAEYFADERFLKLLQEVVGGEEGGQVILNSNGKQLVWTCGGSAVTTAAQSDGPPEEPDLQGEEE